MLKYNIDDYKNNSNTDIVYSIAWCDNSPSSTPLLKSGTINEKIDNEFLSILEKDIDNIYDFICRNKNTNTLTYLSMSRKIRISYRRKDEEPNFYNIKSVTLDDAISIKNSMLLACWIAYKHNAIVTYKCVYTDDIYKNLSITYDIENKCFQYNEI